MNNFKVGDTVWFFWTGSGKFCWGDDVTVIYPSSLQIEQGKIVHINERKDYIHVYAEDETNVCTFGYSFHEDYFFHSKQEAISKMIHEVERLINE